MTLATPRSADRPIDVPTARSLTLPPAPPRAAEAGELADRLLGEHPPALVSFAFNLAHADHPEVLVAVRSGPQPTPPLGLVGASGSDHRSLSAAQWARFFDYCADAVVIAYCLYTVVRPDLQIALESQGLELETGWARSAGQADLFEALSYLRGSVVPLLPRITTRSDAIGPDARLAFALGPGRALLDRLAGLHDLSLESVAQLFGRDPRFSGHDAPKLERMNARASTVGTAFVAIAPTLAALAGQEPRRRRSEAVDLVANLAALIDAEPVTVPTPLPAADWRTVLLGAPATAALETVAVPPAPGPIAAAVLANRGIKSAADLAGLRKLDADEQSHNPYLLKGMTEVAARIRAALTAREPITVFGDYDADGIPATSLLVNWLRHAGGDVKFFIGNRSDGFGLTLERATRVADGANHPSLVITVDCGTSDHEAVNYLRGRGIDVVITDHHLAGNGNPPTPYFINPMRADGETYPFRYLCGCGVAYKVVQALSDRRHEPALYDLIAISTVGDKVPLFGENRFYVAAALEHMRATGQGNLGLKSLADAAGNVRLGSMTVHDFGFTICPQINAVGRMGKDPNEVVKLLTTSDLGTATRLAEECEALNKARKPLSAAFVTRALAILGEDPPGELLAAVVPELPAGIAGLVAARVVERYGKPAMILSEDGHGSGRAVEGGTIIQYVEYLKAAGVFDPHPGAVPTAGREAERRTPGIGGHAGACGFYTDDPAHLLAAVAAMPHLGAIESDLDLGEEGQTSSGNGTARRAPTVRLDPTITLADLNSVPLALELDELEPYLVGRREPALRLTGFTPVSIHRSGPKRDGPHLQFHLTDAAGRTGRATWWWAAAEIDHLPKHFDLVGAISYNQYFGRNPEPTFFVKRVIRVRAPIESDLSVPPTIDLASAVAASA